MSQDQTTKPTITVRAQDVYGKTMFYPVDEVANIFCSIAGRTTLSDNILARIRKLGYTILVQRITHVETTGYTTEFTTP
jgi:hypothetical protein